MARVLVFDPSDGIGGGQRWSKDFATWLSAFHDVTFVGNGEPSPKCAYQYFFDMRPVGVPISAKKHFTWCHVPLAGTTASWIHQTTVIASSKWSAEQVKSAWGITPVVLPLFGKTRGRTNNKGVLFHGRLTVPKGVAKAVEIFRRGNFEVPVTIAGSTCNTHKDALKVLREECRFLGVSLIEDPSESVVDELYHSHSVFLQTAGWTTGPPEAFGLAAADAYLSGLNVIAYPAGAIIEWLPKEHWAYSTDEFVLKIDWALNSTFVPDLDVCLNISDYGFIERVRGVIPFLLE